MVEPPLWKICSSNWVHLPQFSGWKFQKSLSCHHPEKHHGRTSGLFQKGRQLPKVYKSLGCHLGVSQKSAGFLFLPTIKPWPIFRVPKKQGLETAGFTKKQLGLPKNSWVQQKTAGLRSTKNSWVQQNNTQQILVFIILFPKIPQLQPKKHRPELESHLFSSSLLHSLPFVREHLLKGSSLECVSLLLLESPATFIPQKGHSELPWMILGKSFDDYPPWN